MNTKSNEELIEELTVIEIAALLDGRMTISEASTIEKAMITLGAPEELNVIAELKAGKTLVNEHGSMIFIQDCIIKWKSNKTGAIMPLTVHNLWEQTWEIYVELVEGSREWVLTQDDCMTHDSWNDQAWHNFVTGDDFTKEPQDIQYILESDEYADGWTKWEAPEVILEDGLYWTENSENALWYINGEWRVGKLTQPLEGNVTVMLKSNGDPFKLPDRPERTE